MKFRDIVLYRATQDGPVLNAIMLRSSVGVPHRNGQPILDSGGKLVAAEELLDLLYLDPEAETKVYPVGGVGQIAYSVRPADNEAGAPGWAWPVVRSVFPFSLSVAEFAKLEAGADGVEAAGPSGPTGLESVQPEMSLPSRSCPIVPTSGGGSEDDLLSTVKDLKEGIARLDVQLAGCSVAARGWTASVAAAGDYGWSASYQDVLNLRRDYETALKDNIELRSLIGAADKHIGEMAEVIASGVNAAVAVDPSLLSPATTSAGSASSESEVGANPSVGSAPSLTAAEPASSQVQPTSEEPAPEGSAATASSEQRSEEAPETQAAAEGLASSTS